MKQLFILITLGLCSCSMPTGNPTAGQQAVLAHAMSFDSHPDTLPQRQARLAQLQRRIVLP